MTRNRVLVNLVFFAVLFALMVGWAVRNIVSIDQLERPYRLAAEFPNAFGIVKNAEVTYRGVAYGSITDVDRIPGGVRVDMEIQRDKRIPRGAIASILRKSAIGEPYIDFEPPDGVSGGGPFYDPGDVVPLERTRVPLEFSEMLRSASALIESIPPDAVNTLVHEAAVGLQGRAESLRQLADAGDRLSQTFVERTDVLDRLATNNTRLTRVVTEHRGSLGQSLTDLREVAESLKNAKGDTALLLERGAKLLAETADIVASQKANLDCSLKVLGRVTRETNTPDRIRKLTALLDIGPAAFDAAWQARDVEPDGVWIRVGNVANPTHNPPAQFVPPKELPAPRAPEACASPLRPAGIDYEPASTTRTARPAAPAAALGAVVLAGALGALLAGRVLRRRLSGV